MPIHIWHGEVEFHRTNHFANVKSIRRNIATHGNANLHIFHLDIHNTMITVFTGEWCLVYNEASAHKERP